MGLVSMSPNVPVLLVGEHLLDAPVSASFQALRPLPGVSSLWLWAVLNSESGQAIRQAVAMGGASRPTVTRSALASLELPLPPIQAQRDLDAR